MADLSFGVALIFKGAQEFADRLGSLGGALGRFTDRVSGSGGKLAGLGERMVGFGERVGLSTAILSEGARRLHEWSDAMSEPALSMEQAMARTSAMTGIAGASLAKLKDRAIEYTNTHPGTTAEAWVTGFTRMHGVFQDTDRAMAAEDISAKLTKLGVDGTAAASLLTAAYSNLGASATQTGDQLAQTMKLYYLAPESAGQVAMAVGRLGGAAKATHTSMAELFSLVGQAGEMLPGGRGAMMFASMINEIAASGKSGVDWSHGMLAGLNAVKAKLAGLSSEDQLAALKKMGIAGATAPMMQGLLSHLSDIDAKQKEIANSSGILGGMYKTETNTAADQMTLLHQNMTSLADAWMSPALPIFNGWMHSLVGVTQSATTATAHHSTIARAASVSLFALGGSAYYGIQALSALGTMSAFAGAGLKTVVAMGSGLGSLGSAFIAATPTIWAFSAALYANPITWFVAGAILIAGAAYEIYKHWSGITSFFSRLWVETKAIFGSWVNWFEGIGSAMMHGLAAGLEAGALAPIHAIEALAGKIMDHFPHSPAKVGPLRDLGRITIAETIAARRINAGPVVAATHRMAAGVAGAAGAQAGAAGAPGAPGAAGAGVVVNLSYVINGAGMSPRELLSTLKQHAHELAAILDSYGAARERTAF